MAIRNARRVTARLAGEARREVFSKLTRLPNRDNGRGEVVGLFHKATTNRETTLRSESGRWGVRDSRYEAEVALREEKEGEVSVMGRWRPGAEKAELLCIQAGYDAESSGLVSDDSLPHQALWGE